MHPGKQQQQEKKDFGIQTVLFQGVHKLCGSDKKLTDNQLKCMKDSAQKLKGMLNVKRQITDRVKKLPTAAAAARHPRLSSLLLPGPSSSSSPTKRKATMPVMIAPVKRKMTLPLDIPQYFTKGYGEATRDKEEQDILAAACSIADIGYDDDFV